jgi:hypothetical protein
MQKKHFVLIYVVVSLIIFGVGLNTLYSVEPVGDPDPVLTTPKTEKCSEIFGDYCTENGQCSWNLTHGTVTCKIVCYTKVMVNGKEEIIKTYGECGEVAVQEVPEEPGAAGTSTPTGR